MSVVNAYKHKILRTRVIFNGKAFVVAFIVEHNLDYDYKTNARLQ